MPASLGVSALRKCTGQEDGSLLPARAALTDEEDDVLAALQARLDLGEFVLAVDWLFIDFKDDVAARQIHVFGERTGFTSCTITPLPAGISRRSAISGVTLRTVTPNLLCLGAFFVATFFVFAQARGEKLGAIGDVTVASCVLPLRRKPMATFVPGLRTAISATRSDPLLDLLAVDGDDGVANFHSA